MAIKLSDNDVKPGKGKMTVTFTKPTSLRRLLLACLLVFPLVVQSEAPMRKAAEGLEAGLVNPGYAEKPVWFANSFLDIREDVTDARVAGKRVILYFYQDGCPYCARLLDINFALQETENRTRANYEVIAINMWGDREVTGFDGSVLTEKEFARSLRVMFTPTLLFLNEDSAVVLRVNGYYPPHKFNAALGYAAIHNGGDPAFREFYAELSPEPAIGKLHLESGFLPQDTKLNNRTGDKPLLVLFEQKDCKPCDELHLDIFKRPESREQIERFDVVLLDMWSKDSVTRPDGTTGSVKDWVRELDVKYAPSMIFFNRKGKEVFRVEAYLKAFHMQSSMDYVASGAYLVQPSFQRFISARADALEAQGIHIELME